MNRTTLALCAASLLLLATVPLGTAHLTNPNGSDSSAVFSDDDFCRRGDNGPDILGRCANLTTIDGTPALHSGVSGSYVGPTTLLHFITDVAPIRTPLVIFFPAGFIEVFNPAGGLCDVEVGGGGGGDDAGLSDELLSETKVDDQQDVGLIVPDGTWDDGGLGCASHTSHYNGDHSLADLIDPSNVGNNPDGSWELNTFGCGGTAFAEDKVAGDDIWIETSCADIDIQTFDILDCLINDTIFALDLAQAVVCVNTEILTLQGQGPGDIISCGNSATFSPNNEGEGGGNIPHTIRAPAGVPYPSSTGFGACNGVANAAVIVHNAIDHREVENGGDPNHFQGAIRALHVPATVGWIDSSTVVTGVANNPGGFGTNPPICAETKDTTDPAFNQKYACAPAPAGCHGGVVVVYVSGPVLLDPPPLPNVNGVDGSARGDATCSNFSPPSPNGPGTVSATATYGAPPWDAVAANQGPLAGATPDCRVTLNPTPGHTATFGWAQCFIA